MARTKPVYKRILWTPFVNGDKTEQAKFWANTRNTLSAFCHLLPNTWVTENQIYDCIKWLKLGHNSNQPHTLKPELKQQLRKAVELGFVERKPSYQQSVARFKARLPKGKSSYQ